MIEPSTVGLILMGFMGLYAVALVVWVAQQLYLTIRDKKKNREYQTHPQMPDTIQTESTPTETHRTPKKPNSPARCPQCHGLQGSDGFLSTAKQEQGTPTT